MEKSTDCNWRPIKDFEMYEVSDTGLIWSKKNNILLKDHVAFDGYRSVRLYNHGKGTWKFIHRLVAEAFIPLIEGKPWVDHIDGTKDNNVVSNLRWCTKSENATFDNCAEKRRKTLSSPGHEHALYRAGRMTKVICVETGVVYSSMTAAGIAMNVDKSCICVAIKQRHKCCGYHWEKVSYKAEGK